MNRQDIIAMAREAGFLTGSRDYCDGSGQFPFVQSVATGNFLVELEKFHALAIAKDRKRLSTGVDLPPPQVASHDVDSVHGRWLAALKQIRESGWNEHPTAVWMQKVAAHAMEPSKWPAQPDQPPHE